MLNLPGKVSEGHPWADQEVRGIPDQPLQIFERPGKVADVLEGGKIQWIPDRNLLPWTSHISDVELWPPRVAKGMSKKGQMSKVELQEVRARIPELQAGL